MSVNIQDLESASRHPDLILQAVMDGVAKKIGIDALKSLHSGTGAPSSGIGIDGDFYIDVATYDFYGPKTSGAWGSAETLSATLPQALDTSASPTFAGLTVPGGVEIGASSPSEALGVDGNIGLTGHIVRGNIYKMRAVTYQDNADQVWLLVKNSGGNNEVIGTLYGQRSSGHWGAAKIDVLISTADSDPTMRGYIRAGQGLRDSDLWSLVTLTYSGNSYIALRYQGQQYAFSELYFDGLIRSDFPGDILRSLPATSVSAITAFSASGTREFTMANKVGIGTNNPSSMLSVGSSSQFQVSSSGAIVAAAGLASSGTVTLSDLTAGRLVATDGSKNLTSTIALANLTASLSDVGGSTGTGNLVLSASPVLTGTLTAASASLSGMLGVGGAPSINRLRVYGGSDLNSGLTLGDAGTDAPTLGFHVSDSSERARIRLRDVNGSYGDRLALSVFYYGVLRDVLNVMGIERVGIMTATPTATLDVNGTFAVSGATTISGLAGTGTRLVTATSTGQLGNAMTISGAYTFSDTLTLQGNLVVGTAGNGNFVVQSTASAIFGNSNLIVGATGNPYFSVTGRINAYGGSGAEAGLMLTSTTANNATKEGRVKTASYSNTASPVTMLIASNQSAANVLRIGGGSGSENAVTSGVFHAAPNTTTATGTEVGSWSSSAWSFLLPVGIKTATLEPLADLTVAGAEGAAAGIALWADEGDDNADKWLLLAATDGSFRIQSRSSGSYGNLLSLETTGLNLGAFGGAGAHRIDDAGFRAAGNRGFASAITNERVWFFGQSGTGNGSWMRLSSNGYADADGNGDVWLGIGTASGAKLRVFGTSTPTEGNEIFSMSATGATVFGTGSATAAVTIYGGTTSSDYILALNTRFKFRGDGALDWGGSADTGFVSWNTGVAIVGGRSGKSLQLHANNTLAASISTAGEFTINSLAGTGTRLVTATSTGQLGDAATISGAYTWSGQQTTSSLYVNTDANGGSTMAIGNNGLSADTALYLRPNCTLTGTNQTGIAANPIFGNAATTGFYGITVHPGINFTSSTPAGYGVYIQPPYVYAGSYGSYTALHITDQAGTDWAIRTGTGKHEFGGTMTVMGAAIFSSGISSTSYAAVGGAHYLAYNTDNSAYVRMYHAYGSGFVEVPAGDGSLIIRVNDVNRVTVDDSGLTVVGNVSGASSTWSSALSAQSLLTTSGRIDLLNASGANKVEIASGFLNFTLGGNKTFTVGQAAVQVFGAEGAAGQVYIYADDGDDNADKWGLFAETDGTFRLNAYATGSSVAAMTVNGSTLATTFGGMVTTPSLDVNGPVYLGGPVYLKNYAATVPSSDADPAIYATSDAAAGSEPFSLNGNLVLQARSGGSTGRSIYFYTGTTPTQRYKLDPSGAHTFYGAVTVSSSTLTLSGTGGLVVGTGNVSINSNILAVGNITSPTGTWSTGGTMQAARYGVGGTPSSASFIRFTGNSTLAGTTQYGLYYDDPTFSTGATSAMVLARMFGQSPNSSFTTNTVTGLHVGFTKGASHTITNYYGVRVEDVPAATNGYALHTGTGAVQFGALSGTGTRLVTSTSTGSLGNATSIAGNYTFSGATTFSDNVLLSRSYNGDAESGVTNTNTGSSARAVLRLTNNASSASFCYYSSNHSTRPRDLLIANNDAAGSIKFQFNGSVGLTLHEGGNVGIGTETPTSKLEVLGSSAGSDVRALSLVNWAGSTNDSVTLQFSAGSDPTVTTGGTLIRSARQGSSGNNLEFWTSPGVSIAAVRRMSLTKDGELSVSGLSGTGTRLLTSAADGTLGNATTIAGSYTFTGTIAINDDMTLAAGFSGSGLAALSGGLQVSGEIGGDGNRFALRADTLITAYNSGTMNAPIASNLQVASGSMGHGALFYGEGMSLDSGGSVLENGYGVYIEELTAGSENFGASFANPLDFRFPPADEYETVFYPPGLGMAPSDQEVQYIPCRVNGQNGWLLWLPPHPES